MLHGQTIKVSCRVNTGLMGKHIPVLFEPEENRQFPSGLELHESLLTVKRRGGSPARLRSIPKTQCGTILS